MTSRHSSTSWLQRVLGIAAASIALLPGSAAAGGLEVTAYGARALGRGGAVMASAQGGEALRYNPARLASLRTWTVTSDLQLQFGETCFTRKNAEDGSSFPEVCSNKPGVIPQLTASYPVSERVTLALGVLPPAGTAALDFGDSRDGTIAIHGTRMPSPARYALVSSDNLAVFPTLGLGIDRGRLRLGAAFGWGVFILRNVAFTAGLPGDAPALDVRSAVSAVDTFVPRLMLGLDFDATRSWNLALQGTWTDGVRAPGALYLSGVTLGMPYSTRVGGVTLNNANAWEAGAAARYHTERWEFEADLLYQGTSRLKEVVIDVPDTARLPVSGTLDGQDISRLPSRQTIARHWRDQVVLRVGSDYQAIADRLWLRAGLSVESNGVEHGYESVDNLPLHRFGVHAGLGVRVAAYADLNLAYALIVFPTVQLSNADARIEQPVGQRPGQLADAHPTINAGTYKTGVQAMAISIVFHAREAKRSAP
ncbi:MAG: outer membrane protein transport protein [Myxococcales bacterium]